MNIVLRFVGLGFLNEGNAPTVEAKTALSNYTNLEPPRQYIIDKTVVIFHDESTFHANEDQTTFWGEKGTTVLRPKSRSGFRFHRRKEWLFSAN